MSPEGLREAAGKTHTAVDRLRLRYGGLNKNADRLLVTCALTNLFIARRHLSRGQPA
jgi:hypothetical protein